MGLLGEIQQSIVQENCDLGSTLLKLRLFASRMGSDVLEEWVRHESEGYSGVEQVPPYRVVSLNFRGTFSGPFGSGITNAPIPQYLVKKYAGERWLTHKIRESVSAVSELLRMSEDGTGNLAVTGADLLLLLQGKIYPGYVCNEIRSELPRTALSEVLQSVRSRILELTIQLERTVPKSTDLDFGSSLESGEIEVEKVERVSQQIIFGNVTYISGGNRSNINVAVGRHDEKKLLECLVNSGIPREDATELVGIMASEGPSGGDDPFGERAKQWIVDNLKKAVSGSR